MDKKDLKAITDVPFYSELPDDIKVRMEEESPRVSSMLRNLEGCDDCEQQGIRDLIDMATGLPAARLFLAKGRGLLRQYMNQEITAEQFFQALKELLDKHKKLGN